ncbi:GDP-L-galactose phosphorylase 2-like isoform X1 [Pistacia vera]|uniref:GDP-L-galactose phosphorylase 2-like isoform X1 n=1 Tax=Pistacia vera TaxID=55513 RepID=UPI0012639E7E|nr:GDP-L-galactose phosphorylase 2-like isoform X1 [Pistacia vera]XP_031249527.1 GDP-L-galactose phosphorylase 2-like isoform X1 [Pistacia vera]
MVTVKQLQNNKILPKSETTEHLKCPLFSFQGVKTPTYNLGSQSLGEKTSSGGLLSNPEEEQSILDALLLAQWEERMWKGYFRYDVTTSEVKVISGRGKFLAQLTEEWSMDCLSKAEDSKVCHQRDSFLFHRINHHEELLFCVASSDKTNSEFIPLAAVPNGAILIIVNATPLEYGHVFLVPYGPSRLYLDSTFLEMMLRVTVEINNDSFRLFYDCSSAGATHIYFQGCYFPNHLPVELMHVDTFFSDGQKGIRISTVTDYPIKTLLFEHTCNIKIMVELISEICSHLQEKNIPHNLLISDHGKKIFLFFQKQTTSSDLSAWECGGYFLFRSKYEFDQVTEEAMLIHLSTVSLDDAGFEAVKQLSGNIASKLVI